VIHPFVGGFWNNEVDVGRRYDDEVRFPDNEEGCDGDDEDDGTEPFGSLSYTAGDFVETYAPRSHRARLDTSRDAFDWSTGGPNRG